MKSGQMIVSGHDEGFPLFEDAPSPTGKQTEMSNISESQRNEGSRTD